MIFTTKGCIFRTNNILLVLFFLHLLLRTDQIFNEKRFTMNTKRLFFGICTCLILMAASCTPNSTADDQLYEDGVDKNKIIIK